MTMHSSPRLGKRRLGGTSARTVSIAWISWQEFDAGRSEGTGNALGRKRWPDAVRRSVGRGCLAWMGLPLRSRISARVCPVEFAVQVVMLVDTFRVRGKQGKY